MSGQKKCKRPRITYSSKAISAVLAGTMVFGGANLVLANPAGAATAAATSTAATQSAGGVFKDVKTGFWAEKHIYKLASQGIVIGNNGLFRPGDSVTQQEAVLMALRFMKTEGQADTNTTAALPSGFQVSNYYKPYVILAFQQGLLDKSAEMTESNMKTAWGERKASREWIAELLIRALGRSADAGKVANEPTGFADDAKVSASKRGYINAAVDLGLANGLDGNRFDPQGAVTRAQLATFLSRAEAHNSLTYDNTIQGTVAQLSNGKLTLYDNGKTYDYTLQANTAYFSSASESRITLADIQPYTKVTVIGATYNAAYVELTDPVQQVETFVGNVAMFSPGNKLWLKTATAFNEFAFDESTLFVDVNGDKIAPTTIAADSEVSLQRETFSGNHKIVKIQVTSGVVNKTATGTIQSIDLTNKKITFKNASGTAETFGYEEGTSLFSSQNTVILPADLKPNAEVKYTIKENLIRSVEVTSGVERTVEGLLQELTGSTIVYKKSGGSREVKLLAAKPEIVIPNVSSPTADDLIADSTGGDTVRITLNSSEQATKIEVLSRQIEQFSGATVVDYNSKTQLLTIMDTNKKAHVVQLDEKTKLAYEGVTPNLTSVGARLTENRRLNIVALGQRALSLEVVTKYEGTVESLNPNSRTMVVKLNNGGNVTLPYPQTVDLFGKSNATITDVPVGSKVTAALTASQDLVAVLKVKAVLQFETSTINAAANVLGIKRTGGNLDINTYALPLTNESGQTVKLSELKAGDYINVTFDGSTPLALQTVKLTSGQITAVDAAAGSFSVKEYTGTASSFSTSQGVKIIRDGQALASAGSLTSADRVEVRKDADGSVIVRVLPQLSRTYSRFDSTTNELTTKRSNVNDNNYRFRVAANAYIHQGDNTLSVQSLKENDNIIIYLNNDVIVEIVKQ